MADISAVRFAPAVTATRPIAGPRAQSAASAASVNVTSALALRDEGAEGEDGLAAARGITLALLISFTFWLTAGALAWSHLH